MAVRDGHLVSAKKYMFLLTGFVSICVFTVLKEVGRALCTCPIPSTGKLLQDPGQLLDSNPFKLPIRPVWEHAEKQAMLEYNK